MNENGECQEDQHAVKEIKGIAGLAALRVGREGNQQYEVSFKDGNSGIIARDITLATTAAQLADDLQSVSKSPPNVDAADSLSGLGMLGYQNSAASFPGSTADGNLPLTSANDLTTANTTGVYIVGSAGAWAGGNTCVFSNFGFDIPADSYITGITGTDRCFYNAVPVGAQPDTSFRTVQLTLPNCQNKGGSQHNLVDNAAPKDFLRSIHAVELMNLAEMSTGLAISFGLPAGARGILAGLSIEYLKKARGTITGRCTMPPITSSERREYEVPVEMSNEAGEVVATATLRTLVGPKSRG